MMKFSKLLSVFLVALFGFLGVAQAGPPKGDDGLPKTEWMRETFKDLREDLEEANAEGKRLLLLLEQRGCIYCDKMFNEVFPHEEIDQMIKDNYFVVQINLHGSTEITDFDGETLTEAKMARKWGMLFTPTMIFMSKEVGEDKTAPQAAVAMVPGAFGPYTTYNMLQWVLEEGYNNPEEDFQRYHAREWIKLKERGYFQ